MHDSSMAGALLAEVAPVLDLDAVVQHADDHGTSWDIVFDSTLLVEAFFDEPGEKLVLTTDIGVPLEENAARMHRLLLQYNYLWRDTSGTRMALEEPGGNAVMIYDVPLAGLDAVLLRNILQNYAAAARAWITLIKTPDQANGVTLDDSEGENTMDPGLFIRV